MILLPFSFFQFFYWRIVALKNYVVFCQTSTWISHRYKSPPFWTSVPSPSPSHPSRLIQSLCLSFLSHTANSRWLPILRMAYYHVLNCLGFIFCRSFLLCFLPREVPLVFVVKLFWWCWILLVLLVWKTLDFSIKSEWESCWIDYSQL